MGCECVDCECVEQLPKVVMKIVASKVGEVKTYIGPPDNHEPLRLLLALEDEGWYVTVSYVSADEEWEVERMVTQH